MEMMATASQKLSELRDGHGLEERMFGAGLGGWIWNL